MLKISCCTLIAVLSLIVSSNAGTVSVAVLQREYSPTTAGAKGIIQTLEKNDHYALKVINELSAQNLKGIDVVIISHAYNFANKDILREFVKCGGGALLTHDAAGSDRSRGGFSGKTSFPEINRSVGKTSGYMPANPFVQPIIIHPVTEGIKGFKHTYWDHVVLNPVDDRLVLMEDSEFKDGFGNQRFRGTQLRWNAYFGGNPIVIASQIGEGRVVLCGFMLGWNKRHDPTALTGAELLFLENSISWLAKNTPLGLPETIEPTIQSHYSQTYEQSLPEYMPNTIALIDEGKAGDEINVKIATDGRLAEIATKEFRIIVAVEKEGNIPTVQSLQVRDFKWHRTWDGLERNSLTAPILRLSKTFLPFEKRFPSIDHERGIPLPIVKGKEYSFADKTVLKVGSGKIMVTANGNITLEGFCTEGRIATEAIDGYRCDGEWYEESVSYDQPAIAGEWIWVVREDSFAIGGKFVVTDKMGETGLSTGIERQIRLLSEKLIITTRPDQIDSEPKQDNRTLRARKVFLKKLWKMRGKDEFFPILPEPVEIYKDEISPKIEVASWKLQDADEFLIAFDNNGEFKKEIDDSDFAQAVKRLDPHSEDKDLWRRLFVHYAGKKIPIDANGKLIGLDKSGKTVLVVPLKLSAYISLPIGIFTYTAQWTAKGLAERTPPSQWPKLIRDISLRDLDYIIHTITQEGKDPAAGIMQRLNRYGMWNFASVLTQPREMLRKTKTIDSAKLEHIYSNIIQKYGNAVNIIGWYLSDEWAQGKLDDETSRKSYSDVKLIYDTMKKLDQNRWLVNLVSRSFTPYETACEHITSDVFSWDPYGVKAKNAYKSADIVDRLWRKVKDKPAWITLRCGGPRFYDCLDLWLDIRRRSAAAYRGNVDGINYFMYAHWLSDMEKSAWSAVFPGRKGPIATPRWQGLGEVVKDVTLLATAEYLLQEYTGSDKVFLQKQYDQAEQLAQDGQFHHARTSLRIIIKKTK